MPSAEKFKLLSKAGGEQILYSSILARDVAGQIRYLLTIAETSDGKKHLAGINTLPSGIVVKADAEQIESLLRQTTLFKPL